MNNRKFYTTTASSLLFLLLLTGISSCKKQGDKNTDMHNTVETTDNFAKNEAGTLVFDSVYWEKTTDVAKNGKVSVKIRYPYIKSEHHDIQDSIFAWEKEMLESKDSKASFLELARECGAALSDSLTKDMKSILEVYKEEEPKELTYDMNISVDYEDNEYFTLVATTYTYYGGAHGSTIVCGQTFRKADGKRVGWELLSGYSAKELKKKIKHGLKGYFNIPSDAADSENQLMNSLMIDDEAFRNDFPLPEATPYLSAKGVCIQYQQYEIACYAAGMPECYIPVKK